jgi:hypothetical protein
MAAVPFWHQPFLAKPSGWRFSTPLIADPLGAGKQVNPSDFLSLIAELGVALVAAAGIVTAIGGRGRVYTPLDRATIRGLVVVAATPLAIALLGLVMLSADASTARIWSSVSYAYVSVVVIRYALTFPDSIRVRIQDPSLPRRGLVVSTVLSVGVALFLLHNAVVLATFWPIVAACSYEILIAVWLILRLLLGSRFGATEPPSD